MRAVTICIEGQFAYQQLSACWLLPFIFQASRYQLPQLLDEGLLIIQFVNQSWDNSNSNYNVWGFFSHHQAILQHQIGILQFNSILNSDTTYWR